MATFLIAHGAWSAGWAWKKMRPLLRARGHELFTPTHSGLGERAHLASPDRRSVMVEADQAWAMPRRTPQPLKTFEQKLRLHHGEPTLPRHYIYCQRCPSDDRFRQFYERAKREGWGNYEIDASHNPHITAPEALASLLDGIAVG